MLSQLRLNIVEYFGSLINQIDLKAETLMLSEKFATDSNLVDIINKTREKFIAQLKSSSSYNLSLLNSTDFSNKLKNTTNDQEKINELLFKEFCFILDPSDEGDWSEIFVIRNLILGYLVVTDKYISQESLSCYRDILKIEKSRSRSSKINLNYSNCYFNLKKQFSDDYENKPKISFNYNQEIYADENLIRVSLADLFAIENLKLDNLVLNSLKPEVKSLFMYANNVEFVFSGILDAHEEIIKSVLTIISVSEKRFNNFSLKIKCNQLKPNEISQLNVLGSLICLNLSSNRIYSVHAKLFNNLTSLEELNLSRNKLESIGEYAFSGLSSLKRLDLDSNSIISMHSNAFSGLTNLGELIIKNNKIVSLDSLLFRGLTNLKVLHLQYNELFSLESLFIEPCNLSVLNLSANKINKLERSMFKYLINLEKLALNNNEIESLDLFVFSDLANLKELWLFNNNIELVGTYAFVGLSKLEKLHLSQNKISLVEDSSFACLNNLHKLCLDQNLLSSTNSATWKGLKCLKELNLSSNRLSSIEPSTFSELVSLEVLELSRNQIDQLEPSVFSSLLKLSEVNLKFNRKIINLSKIEHLKSVDKLLY